MKYITILGLVLVSIIAFGYYTLFSSPANETASEAEAIQDQLSEEKAEAIVEFEPQQGAGSLRSLQLLGVDLECAIVHEDSEQGTAVEGTYFVSDGDMRGDFLTESPDLSGQVLSSMIVTDSVMYIWSEIEGESYGMKVDLAAAEESSMHTQEAVPLDANVQYDCKPWKNVDRTVFEPPADVLFQDMNDLIPAGMEYGTIYNSDTSNE